MHRDFDQDVAILLQHLYSIESAKQFPYLLRIQLPRQLIRSSASRWLDRVQGDRSNSVSIYRDEPSHQLFPTPFGRLYSLPEIIDSNGD
jgi:hypothetical protein